LHITPDLYRGIALTVVVVALVGGALRWWLSRLRTRRNAVLLDSILAQQPARSARDRPAMRNPIGSVPATNRSSPNCPSLATLEGHLRNAIISGDARERLVKHAMRTTGGDRAAAIRKVLNDLHAEDRRFS
jgi:hypothetical protein